MDITKFADGVDEQRQKDINRASVAAVNSLAKAFGCTIEDLMEC